MEIIYCFLQGLLILAKIIRPESISWIGAVAPTILIIAFWAIFFLGAALLALICVIWEAIDGWIKRKR